MKEITVCVNEPYRVCVDKGLLKRVGELIAEVHEPGLVMLVTDANVDWIYSKRVTASLQNAGFDVRKIVLPAGEKAKSASHYMNLLNFMADIEFTRSDLVVALGGGTISDVAGFAAATYERGVDIVHIPTTLLGMVDSSVGGKTAINLAKGKNLAGAFWQPKLVICDPNVFDTLPDAEFSCGAAEVIKCAVISGRSMLDRIIEGALETDTEEMISECVKLKASIVEKDERESGERRLLNLGHTIGHAIEKLSDYEIPHGEAVGIGLAVVSRASFNLMLSKEDCFYPIYQALKKYGLPSECDYSASSVTEVAFSDKKRRGSKIQLVIPERIGECVIYEIDKDDLYDFISEGI